MATPTKTGRERQEESSNAGGKPGLRKPVFTKVDQLKPGTGGQTLTVEVLNSIDVLPKGLWVSHHLRQSRIADTGSIIFTPRNDQEQERNPVVPVTPNNPLSNPIIIQQETLGFPISVILNETNYTLWSQLMEMRIGARNKLGYLTGATTKPALNDPNYDAWITENYKVKSWLIESMSPHLMQRFICLVTAREIWEAVSKTFYDGSDETRLFELNQQSLSTTQNGRSLSTYYNELVTIFQEIDHCSTPQAESVEGIVQIHAAMMRLRVHIFLSGLNPEYDQIRREILRKEPKLDLEATYACVRRESQQHQVMGVSRTASENTAMITSRYQRGTCSSVSKGKNNPGVGKPNNHVCTHCGETGHSKLRCYELIGYPEWWDFSKKPWKHITRKAAMATSSASIPTQKGTSMRTANITQPGSIGKASVLFANTMDNTWVINTGASDHMIRDS